MTATLESPPETRHRMATFKQSGHALAEWDVNDPASVTEAERVFQQRQSEGFAAFSETPSGPTQTHTFDPHADTLFLPPMVGG